MPFAARLALPAAFVALAFAACGGNVILDARTTGGGGGIGSGGAGPGGSGSGGTGTAGAGTGGHPPLMPCQDDQQCPSGTLCSLQAPGGFCVPTNCNTDADCASYAYCNMGSCLPKSCMVDADCGPGAICSLDLNICDFPGQCSTNLDCGGGGSCDVVTGLCIGPMPCTKDTDCLSGQTCQAEMCVDVTGCLQQGGNCDSDFQCCSGVCNMDTSGCD